MTQTLNPWSTMVCDALMEGQDDAVKAGVGGSGRDLIICSGLSSAGSTLQHAQGQGEWQATELVDDYLTNSLASIKDPWSG